MFLSARHLFPLLVKQGGASFALANDCLVTLPWPDRIPFSLGQSDGLSQHVAQEGPVTVLPAIGYTDAGRKRLCFPAKLGKLEGLGLQAAGSSLSLHVENAVCRRSLGIWL